MENILFLSCLLFFCANRSFKQHAHGSAYSFRCPIRVFDIFTSEFRNPGSTGVSQCL